MAVWLWLAALLAALPPVWAAADETDEAAAAMEKRLADAVQHLASDDMEGRGVGTKGLDQAADYIAEQYRQIGLKTDLFDGGPFQEFPLSMSAQLGKDNKLTLVGPPGEDGKQPEPIELKLNEGFNPLMISATAEFDLPLVFVGYGITAEKEKYDDYEGIDVKGKMVVMFRHEPQQNSDESVFNGKKPSEHAPYASKVSNAYDHGAAGIIFCTDLVEIRRNVQKGLDRWRRTLDRLAKEHEKFKQVESPTPEQIEVQREKIERLLHEVETAGKRISALYDPVLPFRTARGGDRRDGFPLVHCRREVLDRIVKASLGKDLAELEEQIDEGPAPHSGELTGWRAVGKVDVRREENVVKNVVAVLEGEGPKAEETIVIGAHYDHMGFRETPPGKREVRNGANDNASGVAAMIEIARSLAAREEKLHRRVVFIAFTAEERGLLGSNHYVNHPLFPLENTVAMLNLDMVGRLIDDKLTVNGTGTAAQFDGLLDELNQPYGLELSKRPGGVGPSDHASFYRKSIPVLFFFTGYDRPHYHKPNDDFETINVPGMRRIGQYATEITVALANAEERPEYVEVSSPRRRPGGPRPYFGCVPDFGHTDPGLGINGVVKDGPAERAGLKAGDVIVKFGESKIDNLEDFDAALRKHKGGDKVTTVLRREGKEVTVEVTLDPPR